MEQQPLKQAVGLLTLMLAGIGHPEYPHHFGIIRVACLQPLQLGQGGALVCRPRQHGLTPTQMALAFCYRRSLVASTIIGVTSVAQLEEDLKAWDTELSPELLKAIDDIRWEMRDPAL